VLRKEPLPDSPLLRLRSFRRSSNVIIVGTNDRGYNVYKHLSQRSGIRVIGFVDTWPEQAWQREHEIPVLGILEKIDSVLRGYQIDEVVFVVPRKMLDDIHPAVMLCQEMGIRFRIAGDLFDPVKGRRTASQLKDWPSIHFAPTDHHPVGLIVKRLLDIFLATVVIVSTFPLMLGLAALIKIMSPGPVLFVQQRSGLNGRLFPMLKFRTMVANAESLRNDVSGMNELSGPAFKVTEDPRITPLGRFLRKYSLDEVPQCLNILVGHMSIVGPRPPIPAEVEQYDDWQRRRLSMRPGLTCIWQVYDRYDCSFDHWMRMDLDYIDRWSLWLDFKLMVQTIPALLKGTGR
jgi:exopolysaccharide biosynthesis polyprenyl glycosylphosphotransferase